MLDLTDPLWEKLDHAYGLGEINTMVAELRTDWDEDLATDLFWSFLCHQSSLYGATYAAVPHLLAIAAPDDVRAQRQEIADFLGAVVLNAALSDTAHRGTPLCVGTALPGLPTTVEAWDRKRTPYRSLVARDTLDPDTRQRYRSYLARPAVDDHDLVAIAVIGEEFIGSLPAIRALCVRALRECSDPDTAPGLLSGIAACDGLTDLAAFLASGSEGQMSCSVCEATYEYVTYGDRMAIYADTKNREDRSVLDYREGRPVRADAVVEPVRRAEDCDDPRVQGLYQLSEDTGQGLVLLHNLLGRFTCACCGAPAHLTAPSGEA